MDPRISVIIPTYNAARFVAQTIDSALGQTLAPLEVIVVDDGSTDDTERSLRSYQDRIRVFRQRNSGPAAARNRGVRESRGNLIALLDHDDVWLPEKLEKQWDCLRNHPAAGLVHSNYFRWSEETGERTLVRGPGDDQQSGQCYVNTFLCNRIFPTAAMIRRECFDRVGFFDESIRPASSDDFDLFLRIARHYEFAYLDEPLALHRRHASNASADHRLMVTQELGVLRKALRDDPELARLVGRRDLNARIGELLFAIGYSHHDDHQQAEARRFFLQALSHQPWRTYTLFLYAMNLAPPSWARALRRFKAGLSRPSPESVLRGARPG